MYTKKNQSIGTTIYKDNKLGFDKIPVVRILQYCFYVEVFLSFDTFIDSGELEADGTKHNTCVSSSIASSIDMDTEDPPSSLT